MDINGIQKLTLLDYPEHCACTVFLAGCNLRCPFCHNSPLVLDAPETAMKEEEFFKFLSTRKGLLDGVCVTGGEPLMRKDTPLFLKKIKDAGFKVKLDTNGCFPDMLKEVVSNGLVDYIAMDIKNSPEKYSLTCGREVNARDIEKSIEIIEKSGVDHEFRTTCVKDFHTEESIYSAALMLDENSKYFLQGFINSGALIDGSCKGFTKEEMEKLLAAAQKRLPNARLRGV